MNFVEKNMIRDLIDFDFAVLEYCWNGEKLALGLNLVGQVLFSLII